MRKYEEINMNLLKFKKLIGKRNVYKLQEEFGGRKIYVPKTNYPERNESIFILYSSDKTPVSELSMLFDLSARRIYQIIDQKLQEDNLKRSRQGITK